MLPSELLSIIAQFTPAVGLYAASHKASWTALKDKAHFWHNVFAHFTPLDYYNEWLHSLKIPYLALICAVGVTSFKGSEHGDYMFINGDDLYRNNVFITNGVQSFCISSDGQSFAHEKGMPWRICVGHKSAIHLIRGDVTGYGMIGFVGHYLMLWNQPTMLLIDAKTGDVAYTWHNVGAFFDMKAISNALIASMHARWDDICIRNVSGDILHRIRSTHPLDISIYREVLNWGMYRIFHQYNSRREPYEGLWIQGGMMISVYDKSKVIARVAYNVQLHGRFVFYVDGKRRLRRLEL